MKVHEYQAKALLQEYGIPVPQGQVARTPGEAKDIAAELGGKAMVKAQVHAGGRGKGGGIRTASSPEEAEAIASALLGQPLITPQTGPLGLPVNQVLVEEPVPTARELYLGIVIEASAARPLVLACESGGIDIEEVSARNPQSILKAYVHPGLSFQPFQGRNLAYSLRLDSALIRPASALMGNLYRLFRDKDCTLAEINPLAVTRKGKLLALDAKLDFDDDALYRHQDIAALRDREQEDPLERLARDAGISYVKLAGDIGCLVNGAGLAMATLDLLKQQGRMAANFLDVGGGASSDRVLVALRIILSDPQVKKILINLFGGILRCDTVARAILQVAQEQGIRVPLVVRMRGTNAEEGKRLLRESGLQVIEAEGLEEAVARACA